MVCGPWKAQHKLPHNAAAPPVVWHCVQTQPRLGGCKKSQARLHPTDESSIAVKEFGRVLSAPSLCFVTVFRDVCK